MQNVSVQRKRNPGDTDKNGIISEYREILREAGASLFLRIHVCKWVYEYCRLATDLSGTSKTMYQPLLYYAALYQITVPQRFL